MNFFFYFKNIKFHNYKFKKIAYTILKGGYLVAPAASALASINNDKKYYEAIKKADIAIIDSGFFCILLKLFWKLNVKKLSGYLFLKNFIKLPEIKNYKILTVDPNKNEKIENQRILYRHNIRKHKGYVSPFYKSNIIQDFNLLKIINDFKPNIIIINISGGKQEVLANFIKKNIKLKISILCLGAAIGFLTKNQAAISDFHDRYYLGWLIRVIKDYKFVKRLIVSIKLINFFKFKF